MANLLDGVLVDVKAGGVLGVEQRVQVPAGHVALQRDAEVRLGENGHAEVGHVVAVGVEDAAHGVSRQLDGADNVGGVYVGELRHSL